MKIDFYVPGDAKTSGSKKGFYNKKTKKVIIAPDNPKQKDWMAKVAYFALQKANRMIPIDEPVIMFCTFYRPRPSGHFRTVGGQVSRLIKLQYANAKPGTRPDELKLCRAVEDSLSGIIYTDDSRVCDHHIRKRYCSNGQVPGVQITIETYDEVNEVKGSNHGKEQENLWPSNGLD